MKKKNLPYSNRLIIENEIRVYWGESHAWNLAKPIIDKIYNQITFHLKSVDKVNETKKEK